MRTGDSDEGIGEVVQGLEPQELAVEREHGPQPAQVDLPVQARPQPGGGHSAKLGQDRSTAGDFFVATADYLHRYFEPTARAIDGLEKALAGLGLLDDALALDLRKPQDYFHRVWSTVFRATDLADAGTDEPDEYSDTSTADSDDPEQDAA
ncbi:hypothetical protein V1460_25730 [Streptomyces sp. SCSIO 30461]|uniref:hypothetical protein n=1 Tax=Streptomyces sp. SCSIO 30461 TaxID=3118085 RepID=UPI0030D46260